jgi:hypothetical protein
MTYAPDLDFEEDIEDLSPQQAHDRWEDVTNLQADDLRAVQDSRRNDIYLDRAEGNQGDDNPPIPGGPLDDAIHLASTPRSEWGPDERTEADEALNFLSRTLPQFDDDEGEPLRPDVEPRVHKDEMSLIRWGVDPNPDDGFPGGER